MEGVFFGGVSQTGVRLDFLNWHVYIRNATLFRSRGAFVTPRGLPTALTPSGTSGQWQPGELEDTEFGGEGGFCILLC